MFENEVPLYKTIDWRIRGCTRLALRQLGYSGDALRDMRRKLRGDLELRKMKGLYMNEQSKFAELYASVTGKNYFDLSPEQQAAFDMLPPGASSDHIEAVMERVEVSTFNKAAAIAGLRKKHLKCDGFF